MKKKLFSFQQTLSYLIFLLSSLLLLNTTDIKASDLITQQITVPGPTVDCNQSFKPEFEICNINIYDALSNEWSVSVVIKDQNNNVVFSETVNGVFLGKGSAQSPTCVSMQTTNSFTPTTAGSYTITVDVNYLYDINTENDTKISEFGVTCGADLTPLSLQICDTQIKEATSNTLQVNVSNISNVDVFWYDWNVVVTIRNSQNVVLFTTTISGVDLPANSDVWVTSTDTYTPTTIYELENLYAKREVNYSSDVNTSNNILECSFSVLGDPSKPTEPSPAMGETGVSASPGPLLEWNNGGQSTIDEWVINLAPTPLNSDPSLNSVITLTTPTSSYQWAENLEGNTDYEWRVDLINAAGRTNGDVWGFTTTYIPTDLGVKEISSPTTVEFENTSLNPTFKIENYGATPASGADWSVNVKTDDGTSITLFETIPGVNLAAGAVVELSTSGSIILTTSLDVILEVVYPNDLNGANNSQTVSVVVYGSPSGPLTPFPADGAIDVSISYPQYFQFTVVETPPANEYGFTIAVTPETGEPSWAAPVTATINTPGTLTHTLNSELLPGTNYSWKIELTNPAGTTQGDIWTFTTSTQPTDLGVKEVSSPETVEFENTSVTPTFIIKNYGSSNANAADWSVEVRTNDGTNTTLFETIPGVNLVAGAEIELKTTASIALTSSLNVSVELNYPNDTNGANNSETVTVVVYGVPSSPLTPFPADGAVDVPYLSPKEFQFTVEDNIPTKEYGFTIAVTPVSGEPSWAAPVTATINTPGTLTHTLNSDLLPGTEYSWRIDLTNPAGTTEGNVWTFATSSEPTDLGVEEILRPASDEFDNVPINPSFSVKNFGSVQADAADWTAVITISDIYPPTPSLVFQETIQGVDLAPGANTNLITSAAYTPYAGTRFLVHVRIDYPNDANNSNDEGESNFVVYPPPMPPTSPIFPTEGATNIPFDTPPTCTWENPDGIPIDEVKISWLTTSSVEPECGLAVPVTATFDGSTVSCTWPGELVPDQEYWWRIIQSNPAGETCSEVFSFSTASAWNGVQLLPGEGVEFSQVDFTFPEASQENSSYGLCVIDNNAIQSIAGFNSGFVNVVTNDGWAVSNMIYDIESGYSGISTFFNLNTTIDIITLDAFILVTPEPIIEFDFSPIHTFDVGNIEYNAEGRNEISTTIATPIPFKDIPFDTEGKNDLVWQHDHPSIEQDINQCGPASVANSFQWLKKKKGIKVPDEHKPGIKDSSSIVGKLDKAMKRDPHKTVSDKNMLEGKIKYIDENGISNGLVVKHKNRKGKTFVSNDTVKVGNTISIPHTDTTVSLIDWIISELKHGEDVELGIGWTAGGGHWVDLIGGGYVDGIPWLAWVHDAKQGFDDNGTPNDVSDDKVKNNGGITEKTGGIQHSYIINNKLKSGVSVGTIDLALSESKDSTTTSIQDYSNNLKPSEFKLEQNYPNPFNPVATINYQIPVAGFVSIKLYDLNGREVKVLVNQNKDAGSHKVEFNGNDLASGVYFYRMEVGNINITKKAILLK